MVGSMPEEKTQSSELLTAIDQAQALSGEIKERLAKLRSQLQPVLGQPSPRGEVKMEKGQSPASPALQQLRDLCGGLSARSEEIEQLTDDLQI